MTGRLFIVTIQRVITTEIEIDADDAKHARWLIQTYGPARAVVDKVSKDVITTAKIKSVRAAQ